MYVFLRYLNVMVQFCFLALTRNFLRRLQNLFVLLYIPHEDLVLENEAFQSVGKKCFLTKLLAVCFTIKVSAGSSP